MGVHFKPGGAFCFLGVPSSELTDIHVNLPVVTRAQARSFVIACTRPMCSEL
jgi:hypothetical protein